jgi:hypothetical protein
MFKVWSSKPQRIAMAEEPAASDLSEQLASTHAYEVLGLHRILESVAALLSFDAIQLH